MDRIHALEVFVKVAERQGFAAAARDLNISAPAVTRAVAALEDRLGTRLFVRTTRSVRLTESGERFLRDGRRILSEIEEAEAAAVGSHAEPRGELRITAPVLFGRTYVVPIIGDFLDQYPLVTIQTLFVDRVVNLMDEGLDVAIRIGDLPDSSLTAVRAGTVRRCMFVSPGYIDENGMPRHPSDLADHRVIQPLAMGASRVWPFQENGTPISVQLEPRVRINTNDAVIELALRGWGVSRLLSYQIAPYVADGRLQTVLDAYEPAPMPIHVLHQEGQMVSSRVRSFVDFLVARLRADAALN